MKKINNIQIYEINKFSVKLLESIRRLAKIEGDNYKELTEMDLKEILDSPCVSLYVAEDLESNKIIGMVSFVLYRIPYVRKASMEDLVVDEVYRGQGIGTELIKSVVAKARNNKAAYLDFTSRSRRNSNNLYSKLGFKQRDTNVYRYIIDYKEV